MIALFILIYLVSLVVHLVVCYKENKRHIFCVGDLLDEIEVWMCFPVLNTVALIAFVIIIFIITTWKVTKLGILWQKFRNIKLKEK